MIETGGLRFANPLFHFIPDLSFGASLLHFLYPYSSFDFRQVSMSQITPSIHFIIFLI